MRFSKQKRVCYLKSFDEYVVFTSYHDLLKKKEQLNKFYETKFLYNTRNYFNYFDLNNGPVILHVFNIDNTIYIGSSRSSCGESFESFLNYIKKMGK